MIQSDAKSLLRAAVEGDGTIIMLVTFGGTSVQAGGQQFAEMGNDRSRAQWKAAVEELEQAGLIEARGFKRQIFDVTHRGYKLADDLAA